MIDISLKVLSNEIKISVKELIKNFSEIGISKNENDLVNISEKKVLLKHLRKKENISENTFILQRKTRSTLNVSLAGGKNKSVQVEVRKKRTYTKNMTQEVNNLLKDKILVKNKENNFSKPFEKKVIKEKIFKENIKIVEKSKSNKDPLNKLNRLKNSSTLKKNEKNKISKRNVDLNKYSLNVKKTIKENLEHKKFKEETKDYNLTTFFHTQNIENDDHHNDIEKNKRNYNRNVKNSRQKKNNKQNINIKNKKEENRIFKNKKNVKLKNKSVLLQQVFKKPASSINRDVVISNVITVSDLANKMAVKSSEVIKTMMNMGIIGTINHILDQDTAQIIAEEMGHKVILRRENALEELIMKDRDLGNDTFIIRSPVVTIMGHVDHGKTSLLDYIRSTKIASNEAGGITQNIGAYHVKTDLGSITFLDTPGHSAFTGMRSRGVKITDIVVLVVAADDGVKPQTIEAIQHAKEANVPIIVAINKIDKIDSDTNQIKNDLTKHNIISEEWGGENIFVSISAKTGKGIDELLNAILLQSEMLELKEISTGMAEGVVIESSLDKGRGPVATVLVQKGNLKKGDIILCGLEYGRIKSLRNETGKLLQYAGPSIPVEILGLSKVPFAGDQVTVVRDEKKAKEVACYRKNKSRELKLANQNRSSLENMFNNIKKSNFAELKVIVKSDVQGSLEAISGALLKLSTDEVKINIIGLGIGGITETDASLALASNAIILGFNVRADVSAKKIIDTERLDLRYYSVIYDLIDEVKAAMTGLLSPEYKQNIIGLAEVRNTFKSPKFGLIAGCMVISGVIKKNNSIRVLRDNVVIYEGELESLRRFKEDVNEIRNGMECGIGIKNYNDIKIGDNIEVFEVNEIQRIL
ncbi:translation initiation factor IF-2 [Buchnera aphidicola (Aphis helianthi)]|uniref:Translation initiation factor IF-2 n=1 Tax=Buchnera aphidicola (Aphis helianthi) TaxID=2315802 RepID=A0A4D6XQF3_9GAMM|nr:translation initiation factor IF-2 [Buchnera aphidicola]QCI17194.1 translation initiation factor IF-2 [Buchnera aphidicola (Aphis helianthi)]